MLGSVFIHGFGYIETNVTFYTPLSASCSFDCSFDLSFYFFCWGGGGSLDKNKPFLIWVINCI